MTKDDEQHGFRAVREYQVAMPNGNRATIAMTLCDPDAGNTVAAEMAKPSRVYGLISVQGLEGMPRHPVIWVQRPTEISYMVADGDAALSPDLLSVVVDCLRRFFRDISDIAPELEHMELPLTPPGLH
jgi:hypothetical protein